MGKISLTIGRLKVGMPRPPGGGGSDPRNGGGYGADRGAGGVGLKKSESNLGVGIRVAKSELASMLQKIVPKIVTFTLDL